MQEFESCPVWLKGSAVQVRMQGVAGSILLNCDSVVTSLHAIAFSCRVGGLAHACQTVYGRSGSCTAAPVCEGPSTVTGSLELAY